MSASLRTCSRFVLVVVAIAAAGTVSATAAPARIGTVQIINNSIRGIDIRNSTITSADVNLNALNAGDLAVNSVGASELAKNSVTAADITTGAVTTLQLLDGSVGNNDLASNSVTASKIASDAVGNSELADNAVTASRIAASAVGQSEIATNGVDTAEIDANAVTSSELAAGSVTPDKLAPTVGVALSLAGSDNIDANVPQEIDGPLGWTERYDNGGLYDAGTKPAFITATRAGWYQVSARIQWELDGAGEAQRRILSIVTGVPIANSPLSTDPRYAARDEARFTETIDRFTQSVDAVVRVNAGDRIWLEALQANPGDEAIAVSTPDSPDVRGANFRAVWLGA